MHNAEKGSLPDRGIDAALGVFLRTQRWLCGALKDWLVRTVATTLYDGGDSLTLERIQEHVLGEVQWERLTQEAVTGERELEYPDQRRQYVRSLLRMDMEAPSPLTSLPTQIPGEDGTARTE